MLTIWPVNSTPRSCSQAMVAADSSTIALTRRAFGPPVAVLHDVLEGLVAAVVDEALALHPALDGEGAVEEVGGAAQSALLLEQGHGRPALRQGDGRGQAGRPGTRHHHVDGRRHGAHSRTSISQR